MSIERDEGGKDENRNQEHLIVFGERRIGLFWSNLLTRDGKLVTCMSRNELDEKWHIFPEMVKEKHVDIDFRKINVVMYYFVGEIKFENFYCQFI